jgi:hypothetical protein
LYYIKKIIFVIIISLLNEFLLLRNFLILDQSEECLEDKFDLFYKRLIERNQMMKLARDTLSLAVHNCNLNNHRLMQCFFLLNIINKNML